MERRDNLFEKLSTAQTEVASLLEGIVKEKNEIKTQRDKLDLRLKKSCTKIKVLRRQIEFYEVAHSKLKKIFLSGLEVFKQVDFRSKTSFELNKFSLELLQKHFLEYADKVGSLFEIPTELQLEQHVFQKNTKFLEDSKAKCSRINIIISSSDSEDGDPDDTNLDFGTAWNSNKLDGGTNEELLRDSGLESIKEEIWANEIDLSDIQFDEDFSVSTEFAAGETNKGSSEVVDSRNVTITQIIAPSTGGSSTENGSVVRVKPDDVVLDKNPQPNPVAEVGNPAGNQNPQGRNDPDSLHEKNCQRNEPARGIYKTAILDVTPRPETPLPVVFNHSREQLYDSRVLEKGLFNSSREKQYQGNAPVTTVTDDRTSTMMNRETGSPVFKDCNPRRFSGRNIEDFSRNCSTPFRQLNENFGRTLISRRGYGRMSSKKKVLSRRSIYGKPRQEEDGPSGGRKLGETFLNVERFKGNNPEQGKRSEDRENESYARDQLLDYSGYDTTAEDDDDDIIYGSPRKVNQLYLNPRRQEVRREIAEEPSRQPIPQTSAGPDLDETFISPTAVRNYQMSREMGPPLHLPPGHRTTREVSPEYDSVPFAYQREPARKRAERMKLPGQACAECDKYYNNVYGDANTNEYNRMLNKCSRHRKAGGQDDTPPGYWTPFLTGN